MSTGLPEGNPTFFKEPLGLLDLGIVVEIILGAVSRGKVLEALHPIAYMTLCVLQLV